MRGKNARMTRLFNEKPLFYENSSTLLGFETLYFKRSENA